MGISIHVETDLWKLIRKNLPKVDWTRIETGVTAAGVPDINGCYDAREVWIEDKIVHGNRVELSPFQVGWLLTRAEHGGRCFILAAKDDYLYLWHGKEAAEVKAHGIKHETFVLFNSPINWAGLAWHLFWKDDW